MRGGKTVGVIASTEHIDAGWTQTLSDTDDCSRMKRFFLHTRFFSIHECKLLRKSVSTDKTE